MEDYRDRLQPGTIVKVRLEKNRRRKPEYCVFPPKGDPDDVVLYVVEGYNPDSHTAKFAGSGATMATIHGQDVYVRSGDWKIF